MDKQVPALTSTRGRGATAMAPSRWLAVLTCLVMLAGCGGGGGAGSSDGTGSSGSTGGTGGTGGSGGTGGTGGSGGTGGTGSGGDTGGTGGSGSTGGTGSTGDTGGTGSGFPEPDTQPISEFAPVVVGSVEVGRGIISPYRIVPDRKRDDRLFVLTGRGETFSEGWLHVVEPDGLTDLAPPIEVGVNGADLVQDGDHLVVAVRGSQRLALIDVPGWRKLHDLQLDFAPGSIASLGDGAFVVASITDGSVLLVRRVGERLEIARRVSLGTFAYDVTADPGTQRIYVSQPLRGVAILDARTLGVVRIVDLPREPSRGILLWGGRVVVSNRNGYLHFLAPSGSLVHTLDLAASLGLDRATLATRGIDPGDLVDLGDGRLVVMNGRQDSLLLEAGPTEEDPPRVMARMVSGSCASYRSSTRSLYVTLPGVNSVSRVAIPAQVTAGSRLPEARIATGSEIAAATPLKGTSGSVAALTSTGVVRIIDAEAKQVAEFQPPRGESWLPPLISTADGGFALVAKLAGGGESLLHLDRQGAVVGRHPISIGTIFSGAEQDGHVLLVSRLNRKLQLVDLPGGQSQVLSLQRDRARIAASMGGDRWIVLHDTNPDIGITLLVGGQESGFQPFDDWFTGVAYDAARGAVTASFNGSLALVNSDGRIVRSQRLRLATVSNLQPGPNDTVWVTSENLGEAYRVRVSNFVIDARYRRSGIRSIGLLPGTDELWTTTARHVEVLR